MSFSALRVARTLRKHLDEPSSFDISAESSSGLWLSSLGLGRRLGKLLRLDRNEALKARIVILRELEASSFSVLDANPSSRADTLSDTNNEKLLNASPRASRVAVKAFPGRPLLSNGRALWLDPADNLEIDADSIVRFTEHNAVVVVENWESFERLPDIGSLICARLPAGCSPLVVWRGSSEHPIGSSLSAIASLCKPCYAYVDFDPAGLSIAKSLPGFVDMLAPPLAELERMFLFHGRPKLFASQSMPTELPPALATAWRDVFSLCSKHAVGLPQEHF